MLTYRGQAVLATAGSRVLCFLVQMTYSVPSGSLSCSYAKNSVLTFVALPSVEAGVNMPSHRRLGQAVFACFGLTTPSSIRSRLDIRCMLTESQKHTRDRLFCRAMTVATRKSSLTMESGEYSASKSSCVLTARIW